MANLNKVMLMGNITRDPEIRYTPKGTAVTDISLAINRTYTLDDGERREETTYVDVTYWGRQAEIIAEYMRKGRPIYVEGRLQLDQWEDKATGQSRSRLKVVGENFQFLGSREDGSRSGGRSQQQGDDRGAPQGGQGGQGGQAAPARSQVPAGNVAPAAGGAAAGSAAPAAGGAAPAGGGYEPIEEDDDIPF